MTLCPMVIVKYALLFAGNSRTHSAAEKWRGSCIKEIILLVFFHSNYMCRHCIGHIYLKFVMRGSRAGDSGSRPPLGKCWTSWTLG